MAAAALAGPSTETTLAVTTLTSAGGHINLFEDLERVRFLLFVSSRSCLNADVRSLRHRV